MADTFTESKQMSGAEAGRIARQNGRLWQCSRYNAEGNILCSSKIMEHKNSDRKFRHKNSCCYTEGSRTALQCCLCLPCVRSESYSSPIITKSLLKSPRHRATKCCMSASGPAKDLHRYLLMSNTLMMNHTRKFGAG